MKTWCARKSSHSRCSPLLVAASLHSLIGRRAADKGAIDADTSRQSRATLSNTCNRSVYTYVVTTRSAHERPTRWRWSMEYRKVCRPVQAQAALLQSAFVRKRRANFEQFGRSFLTVYHGFILLGEAVKKAHLDYYFFGLDLCEVVFRSRSNCCFTNKSLKQMVFRWNSQIK